MQRREVLRILATGTALQLAPRKLITVLREGRLLLQSQASAHTLNPHQAATVKAMAELILPRTETPGAADVGATDFIDLMLTEWYDDADRTRFLNGLAGVDSRSTQLFGKDFVDCSAVQQEDILTYLGEKMAATGVYWSRTEHDFPTDVTFYGILRRLTITAYYTSEKGATEELHFEIVPGQYEGCKPLSSTAQGPEQK
jgi:glucoside 3-dehydrogenase (cytochrome c) hitch-hiker subunit